MKLKRTISINTLIALALIAFGVCSRLLPHPPNFTALAAVAIFSGAIMPKKWALSLPLITMIVSDLLIGLHPLVLFTWGSFVASALLGGQMLKTITLSRVFVTSIAASLLFFIVSNFGVWMEGRMYTMTLAGLLECYYKALPFFRNTILGDLFFSGLLFGMYALANSSIRYLTHNVKQVT